MQETVSKYTVEIDNGKKKVKETIEIDTDKETETYHVPDSGDTSKSSPGEVKTIFDFKKVSNRGGLGGVALGGGGGKLIYNSCLFLSFLFLCLVTSYFNLFTDHLVTTLSNAISWIKREFFQWKSINCFGMLCHRRATFRKSSIGTKTKPNAKSGIWKICLINENICH